MHMTKKIPSATAVGPVCKFFWTEFEHLRSMSAHAVLGPAKGLRLGVGARVCGFGLRILGLGMGFGMIRAYRDLGLLGQLGLRGSLLLCCGEPRSKPKMSHISAKPVAGPKHTLSLSPSFSLSLSLSLSFSFSLSLSLSLSLSPSHTHTHARAHTHAHTRTRTHARTHTHARMRTHKQKTKIHIKKYEALGKRMQHPDRTLRNPCKTRIQPLQCTVQYPCPSSAFQNRFRMRVYGSLWNMYRPIV